MDGAPLTAPRELLADQLEQGVVLELGDGWWCCCTASALQRRRSRASACLIGESEELERVRAHMLRVAPLPVPVLVRGESGTEKEFVARAI